MYILAFVTRKFWASVRRAQLTFFPNTYPGVRELDETSLGAKSYKEWLGCQEELDELLEADQWRFREDGRDYESSSLRRHMDEIGRCQKDHDILALCGLLRSHPVRNICKILSPSLYTHARAGTKYQIEEYVDKVRKAIKTLAVLGSAQAPFPISGFDSQTKQEVLHDTRQALGRSTLLLQGGSAFSMSHVGVVKGLHEQGLLPKIITGTATGALIAAVVCVCTDTSLSNILKPGGINLDAFENVRVRKVKKDSQKMLPTWLSTIWRRVKRYTKTGHFFDIKVLQDCAKANLGELTFEEAFAKTGRILNITVALPDEIGVPQLLNYVTAPNVLIWSAVVASTATSKAMYAPVSLVCKERDGSKAAFYASDSPHEKRSSASLPKSRRGRVREAPLKRIGELFNVNHFIVSQARPYVIPLARVHRASLSGRFWGPILRWVLSEVFHLFKQLNTLGYLSTSLGRVLMDETIPNASPWAKISLIPELSFSDFFHLFDIPTHASLDEWILRGERSVWPAVCELQVRCGIEFELDSAYESVRRNPKQNAGRLRQPSIN